MSVEHEASHAVDNVSTENTWTEAERNLHLEDDERPPLHKFVLTGGPCGGKTTALATVFSFLRERNFEVINVPEAWGILSSNGMSVDMFSTEGMAPVIQGAVLDTQIALEDSVERVLRARGKPAVILCDRGAMDGRIYIAEADFQKVMNERGTNLVELRDKRYDACFHMTTAADGAEAYYTLENNKVRWESKEEAKANDKRTQKVWTGHPHLYVLDNSTDFEGKLSRLVDIISKIVGLPSNLKRRSAKYLLKSPPDESKIPPEIDYQVFDVQKVYIVQVGAKNDDEYSFIRRRTSIDLSSGKNLGSVYQITRVRRADNGDLIEQKRIISEREYASAYESRDRTRHIIKQRRISFLYEKQSFNVHIYEAPTSDISILHAQVESKTNQKEHGSNHNAWSEIKLPPFLDVDRLIEPTKEDEQRYGAYSLSLIKNEK